MAMVFELIMPLVIPTSVPDTLVQAWADGAGDAAMRKTKTRWDQAAQDPSDWTNNVATPSNRAWGPMVDSTFVSRSGRTAAQITGQQLQKLSDAHANAVAAHDRVFADDGALFKAAVESKKDNWARGILTGLALTGSRHGGVRGPAAKATLAVGGDFTFQRDLGPGDVMHGDFNPTTPFIDPGIRQQFKAAMMGILTQCGKLILSGTMLNTDANDRIDMLLTGFLDATYTAPDTSYIHFLPADGGYELHVFIDLV